MGSDESHINVSVESDGQSDKTVSTNHNLFEEKGEPKWYRTKVLLLTSLTGRPNQLTGPGCDSDDDDEVMLNVLRCQLTYITNITSALVTTCP